MSDTVTPCSYVLYDDDKIIALLCPSCVGEFDTRVVPIYDEGVIQCLRCGKVA
jgi:uncharacterized Zn finger protein